MGRPNAGGAVRSRPESGAGKVGEGEIEEWQIGRVKI